MMRCLTNGLLLFSCLLVTSCTTQTGLSEGFDQSVKSFNRMVRWQELENAGMTFIDPDLREEYLKQAVSLKKRGLAITDYRILTTRYIPEKKTGDVVTEFDYYLLPSNRVKTIFYRQNWMYVEDSKSWKLKSSLPLFE